MEQRELSQLKTNPRNPRGQVLLNPSLKELAASIVAQGILQPVLITPDGTIVAGHRRAKAAEIAGLKTVPVIVRDLSESEQIQIMLIENLQRDDLDPVQEGKGYLALIDHGLSSNQIAKAIGIAHATVVNRTALASLPERTHEAFASRRLSTSCVDALKPLSPDDQVSWVTLATVRNWSGSKLARQIIASQQPERERKCFTPSGGSVSTLERIWERVQDGCYTPQAILTCGECGHGLFNLSSDQVYGYLQKLVDDGRAEWRKEGGKKEHQKGGMTKLCVPADLPSGEGFEMAREKTVWSEEAWN